MIINGYGNTGSLATNPHKLPTRQQNAATPAVNFAATVSGISRPAAASYAAVGASTTTSPAAAAPESAVVAISQEARALLAQRQVAEADVQSLQSVLSRFRQSGAGSDPKAFLGSLNPRDLAAIQRANGLAGPIDVAALSDEGAANLLVEPGQAADLNNDGLTRVGAANLLVFPPQNAPESFKSAWKKATEGMSPLDVPGHLPLSTPLANIRRDPVSGKDYSLEPGDPRWVNPYADPNFDYGKKVGTIIEGLNYEVEHGMISRPQFDRDMAFYRRLAEAMAA